MLRGIILEMRKSREVAWLVAVVALVAVGIALHAPGASRSATMQGIAIGDSRDTVEKILGRPDREFQERGPDEPWALRYRSLTIWLDRTGHVKRLAGFVLEKDGRVIQRAHDDILIVLEAPGVDRPHPHLGDPGVSEGLRDAR